MEGRKKCRMIKKKKKSNKNTEPQKSDPVEEKKQRQCFFFFIRHLMLAWSTNLYRRQRGIQSGRYEEEC